MKEGTHTYSFGPVPFSILRQIKKPKGSLGGASSKAASKKRPKAKAKTKAKGKKQPSEKDT